VECSVKVVLRAGVLEIAERPSPTGPPIPLTERKGTPIVGLINVKNIGERSTEFKIDIAGVGERVSGVVTNLTVTPATGSIPAGGVCPVTVTIPTENLVTGNHKATLIIRTSGNQTLNVPFAITIQSQMEYFKSQLSSRLSGRLSKK
jgi:hypothetical protein